MIKLPTKNTGFEQLNLGDRLGDLWSSFNLDLSSNYGVTRISPRMLLNINTTDDAQLDAPPCAFKTFITGSPDSYIWAIAGGVMWKTTAGGQNYTFAQDATASTPTNLSSDTSDMEVMSQNLVVIGSDDIYKYNGSWTAMTNQLASQAGLHAVTYFRLWDKIYIIDDTGAGISSLDNDLTTVVLSTSGATFSLNDLGVTNELSCIASNSSRIGIGTINQYGSYCRFFTWDGSQTTGPNETYLIDATGVLAVKVVDDVFTIFDTKGRLMQLNGGTFVEIARLPLEGASLKLPVSTATSRPVHYNGMNLVDGNIEILINTQLWDTNSTVKENCPSGIWCYDRQTKHFYHKRSIGLTKSGGTIVDYGSQKLSKVGALSQLEVITTNFVQGSVNGTILAGCDYYTSATATSSGIFYDDTNDTLQKAGGFTTSKIFSQNITDTFNRLVLRFKKFLTATDKMIVKYRTSEEDSTEFTITWASTTSFTTTNSAIVGKEGYEIEVLSGVGAGRCFHLSTTGYNASNYIATCDETITGATGTAKVRMQNWKKLGSYSGQTKEVFETPLVSASASVWVQFKVWFLCTGKDEIFDLTIINQSHQPPK